ncbi:MULTISPECIES: OprD family outer membrane porin, partial [unclassified Pseudomonas]|uniref:OprD family outer membrane porin n=1 Tax=unclassified Pseudomonas TaxID=196821 RepID=UPI002449F759
AVGAPGLKAIITYLSGDNIDAASGDRREWERDFRLDYTLQDGALKGLGFSWRNASLRGNTSANDQDENRLIVSYTLPIL